MNYVLCSNKVTRLLGLVAAFWCFGLLTVGSASADSGGPAGPAGLGFPSDPGSLPSEEGEEPELGPSYLYNDGAIPFLWAPLVGRLILDEFWKPRPTPLAFDKTEGGAERADWEVPGWGVTALGGVSAIGMMASGDSARYNHVKGLAQALSTGMFVTGVLKVTFGRYRPDRDAEADDDGGRRSFPSGHATQAFAIATYSILYLNGHVFDDVGWLEGAAYAGIGLGALSLAGERVYHNRHHLLDVTAGGLLGTAASVLFYRYQDRNSRGKPGSLRMEVAPSRSGTVVGFSTTW